jgi:hypothetical protein
MDVKRELQVNVIDYMILSGDIADHSLEDEYRAAAEFTMSLAAQFSITKDRIIFTPGNHDVNWELSQQAYGFVPSFKLPDTLAAGRHIPANPVGALIRNDEQYTRRFEQFDRFVRSIGTGVGYPSDYIDQGVLFKDSSDRILFLSLNSCWELDHYFTTRASINPEALTRVLDSISSAEYDDWLKIAVWHHPVSGDQAMPDDFLEVLAVHGFVIGMHGHIHRAIDPQYIYDERRHIHIIGAGTFGAPSRQQVVGIPLQYNLITINCERRLATVHSRKKETRYGSWSADARWGDKNNPKAHYDIDLNERWGKSRSASQGHNG